MTHFIASDRGEVKGAGGEDIESIRKAETRKPKRVQFLTGGYKARKAMF